MIPDDDSLTATWYVDGGCNPNSGPIATRRIEAAVVTSDGDIIWRGSDLGGSNNIAELWAVQRALEEAASRGIMYLRLYTDSQNNMAWVYGRPSAIGHKINDRGRVLRMRRQIDDLRSAVALSLQWVPREDNLAGHVLEGS